MYAVLRTVLGIGFILSIVGGLWYILWKFVFAPNPVVKEFFDLDKTENTSDKKSIQRKSLMSKRK